MSEIITILSGILVLLIIILIGLVIYKRKKYLESTSPRAAINPHEYSQPQYPPGQTQLSVPKKARFQVTGNVISIEMTLRDSYVIGVEVESREKLDFNQEIALVGEEIIQEKLERVDTRTYPQEKEPEIVDKLQELITVMRENSGNRKKQITDETTPEDPVQGPSTNSAPKEEKKPEETPWHKRRPQKEIKCSRCHEIRKTRWQPKTPEEKYVCHQCKVKRGDSKRAAGKEDLGSLEILTTNSKKAQEIKDGADSPEDNKSPEINDGQDGQDEKTDA